MYTAPVYLTTIYIYIDMERETGSYSIDDLEMRRGQTIPTYHVRYYSETDYSQVVCGAASIGFFNLILAIGQ